MPREQAFNLPPKKRRELLDRSTAEYNESLTLAVPYLQNRGIDPDIADQWMLGVVLDPLPGHEEYKGRLSIPYLTPTGAVDMKFRCIADHSCKDTGCVKYLGESGQQTRLFGVKSLRVESPFICVCEGELDTLCASAAGLPAVGISGANKWRSHWQYVFEGYSEVVVLADGDEAGKRMAENVVSHLYNARVVLLPTGEDVNSFLHKHGARSLRERAGL